MRARSHQSGSASRAHISSSVNSPQYMWRHDGRQRSIDCLVRMYRSCFSFSPGCCFCWIWSCERAGDRQATERSSRPSFSVTTQMHEWPRSSKHNELCLFAPNSLKVANNFDICAIYT